MNRIDRIVSTFGTALLGFILSSIFTFVFIASDFDLETVISVFVMLGMILFAIAVYFYVHRVADLLSLKESKN